MGWLDRTLESLKACIRTIRRQAANGQLPRGLTPRGKERPPAWRACFIGRVNPLPIPPKPTRPVSNYPPPSVSVQRQIERKPAIKRPGPPKRPEFPFAAFSGEPPPLRKTIKSELDYLMTTMPHLLSKYEVLSFFNLGSE
nr:uncharacterized protein LOC116776489 [Danaus plexippus plexippus]